MERYRPESSKYNGIFTRIAKDGTVSWYISGSTNGIPFGPVKVPGTGLTGKKVYLYRSSVLSQVHKLSTDNLKMKFLEAAELWKGWAQDNLAPKTYTAMESRYRRHVMASLRDVFLADVDEPMARALLKRWKDSGLSPPSHKQNIAVINSIYKALRELGMWVGRSPLYNMEIADSKRYRVATLTRKQCITLLHEFKKTRIHYYWMMTLMWRGGMRPSEVLRLRRIDFHMDAGYIHIPDVKTPNRTRKSRQVWFKDDYFLKRAVDEMLEKLPHMNIHSKLFPVALDSPYVQSIFTKCGHNKDTSPGDRVNWVSPYTFRHSYATQALEAGVNIKDVQAMMGHDRLESTMVYVHRADNAAQRGQAKFAAAMDGEQSEPENSGGVWIPDMPDKEMEELISGMNTKPQLDTDDEGKVRCYT